VAHGIRNISRLGWRTNVGAVNLGRTNVTLRINIYDGAGKTITKNATLDIRRSVIGRRHFPLRSMADRSSSSLTIRLIKQWSSPTHRQSTSFPAIRRTRADASGQREDVVQDGDAAAAGRLGRKIDTDFARGVRIPRHGWGRRRWWTLDRARKNK